MRTGSACQFCRSAKVKCDLRRPTCGRCVLRQTPCFGYTEGADFLFRDETANTRQNVLRRGSQRTLESQDYASISIRYARRDRHFKFPKQVSDLETQILERFFMNWVLCPDRHNLSSGHLSDLPDLYHSTPPGHVLRFAVEAVAYAELPKYSDGVSPFFLKARIKYGAALKHLRWLLSNTDDARHDSVLAALLMIDNFELVYLSRCKPLGCHKDGFLYLLRQRGLQQLASPRSFALWRVAHSRVQAHQLLSRRGPIADQQAWIDSLNTELPDLELAAIVFQINKITARVYAAIGDTQDDTTSKSAELPKMARSLFQILDQIESWKQNLASSWMPSRTSAPVIDERVSGPALELLPVWPANLQLYSDIWISYARNYQIAAEAILRESLLDLMHLLRPVECDRTFVSQKEAIRRLAQSIIESVPMILGLVDEQGHPRATFLGSEQEQYKLKRKAVGDFFVLFPLWIVQRAKHTSTHQKESASKMLGFVRSSNSTE